MSSWKHGEKPLVLPPSPEHHSAREAREELIRRVRAVCASKLPDAHIFVDLSGAAPISLEPLNLIGELRHALANYDRKRDA
jgi:hypothetical protein